MLASPSVRLRGPSEDSWSCQQLGHLLPILAPLLPRLTSCRTAACVLHAVCVMLPLVLQDPLHQNVFVHVQQDKASVWPTYIASHSMGDFLVDIDPYVDATHFRNLSVNTAG